MSHSSRPKLVIAVLYMAFASLYVATPSKADESQFVAKASETLGATLVAHCVTSHVNLDLIANSFEAEEIADDQATQLVKLNIQLLDQVGPLVIELTKTADCSEDDRKVLVAIAKSYKAIKAEAKALEAYIGSWTKAIGKRSRRPRPSPNKRWIPSAAKLPLTNSFVHSGERLRPSAACSIDNAFSRCADQCRRHEMRKDASSRLMHSVAWRLEEVQLQ